MYLPLAGGETSLLHQQRETLPRGGPGQGSQQVGAVGAGLRPLYLILCFIHVNIVSVKVKVKGKGLPLCHMYR